MFLRVSVTASHVHIQYGLFGPRIPIDAISDARVERYDPSRHGGWGIRRGADGSSAYSVPGGGECGVKISYVKRGRERRVFASSDRPEELVAAIEKARAGRVRIATESSQAAQEPRLVEEELAELPRERDAKESSVRDR
jgi:hypothetical protein